MTTDQYADVLGDDPTSSTPDGPAALRAAYDKLKVENAELKSREEKREADAAKAAERAKVEAFVTEKGLDPKAVDLIGTSKPEEWYDTYGGLFKAAEAEPAPPPASAAPEGTSALPPEQQAAIAAVSGVEPLNFDPNDAKARERYLDGATSARDLNERLSALGLLTGATPAA